MRSVSRNGGYNIKNRHGSCVAFFFYYYDDFSASMSLLLCFDSWFSHVTLCVLLLLEIISLIFFSRIFFHFITTWKWNRLQCYCFHWENISFGSCCSVTSYLVGQLLFWRSRIFQWKKKLCGVGTTWTQSKVSELNGNQIKLRRFKSIRIFFEALKIDLIR